MPKSLHRYRPFSVYSLAELVNETMWYSRPASFNDPFDCALTIDHAKFEESLEHAIEAGIARGLISKDLSQSKRLPTEKDRSVFASIRARLLSATDNLGLCCFSEDPLSILMWAHYAQQHTGFCVEYLCSETLLEKEVSSVKYSKNLPSLSIADFGPERSARTIELLWRTKAICWKYEREWRALAPEGNKSYPARAPVKAVCFGQRMPLVNREIVRAALRGQKHIAFNEAYVAEAEFAICTRPWPASVA